MQSLLLVATSLLWLATAPLTASGNRVHISAGHDNSLCAKPSTATIEEGGCNEQDFDCHECNNVGGAGNVTYYGQGTCGSSRDAYLQTAFEDSPIFMIEYYADTKCDRLLKSEVYRADGQCHFFTLGIMKIWVAEDDSMAALLSSNYCESDDWYVVMDMNVSVNTGACIPQSDYLTEAVKYVLIGGPASGPKVSVYAGYDDPLCKEPSTARNEEGGCNETDQFECVDYNRVGKWGNVTYYGQGKCSTNRQEYLKSAFAGFSSFHGRELRGCQLPKAQND